MIRPSRPRALALIDRTTDLDVSFNPVWARTGILLFTLFTTKSTTSKISLSLIAKNSPVVLPRIRALAPMLM